MHSTHLFFNRSLICTSLFLIYQWLIICNGQTTINSINTSINNSLSFVHNNNLSLINNSITTLVNNSNDLTYSVDHSNLASNNLISLVSHSKNLTLSLNEHSNSSILSNNLKINSSTNNSSTNNSQIVDLKPIVKRIDLKSTINDNQIESKNLKTNISKILSIQKNDSLDASKLNLVHKNQTINLVGEKELNNDKNVSLNNELVSLINDLSEQSKINNHSNEKYLQKAKLDEKNVQINTTVQSSSVLKSKVVKKASVELDDKFELIKNETLEKVPIKLINSSIKSFNNSTIDLKPNKINHTHLTTIKPNISNDQINLNTSKQLNFTTIASSTITENPKHLNQTIQSLHLSRSEPLISIPHSDQHWMIPNQLGGRYSNVWPNHEKQIEHHTALSNIYTDGQSNSKIIYGRHFYNATRDHVKLFSCGKFYYRTFHLDAENDVLYVGAMDRIYKLNLSNVNRTHCEADSIYLEPHNTKSCISKGKSENYECRNHIRVIQRIENGKRLYVCGTNAHSPKDWILNPNLSELNPDEKYPGIGNGIAKCPFDPSDNSTAVWVENGNPGDLPALYSGTVAEFTRADSVIFRTNLYNFTDGKELYPYRRTVKYDSKWLDKPHFVGSFDIGEYVYFFFRESAVEYINCGKNIFSRVARVCKKDIGGKNILAKNWASFLKARLNCSLPGEFPFYFNEAQHITQHPNDPNTFYGVFSTSNNGLTGSAVCSFTLDSIEKVFLGKFKEQVSSSSQWLPVLTSKVPTPRPGSCHHNTQQLPDSVLNFIRSHPLMDEAVPNQGNINDQYHQTTPESNSQYPYYGNSNGDFFSNGGNVFGSNDNTYANDQQQSNSANNANNNNNFPIFYKKDLIFTKIAVDYLEVDGIKYKLFYIGTSCGKLIKLVQWTRSNGAARSFVLDIIDVFAYNMPGVTTGLPSSASSNTVLPDTRNVRAIEISSKHRSIYVATDHFVKQISLLNCKQRYSSCVQCVRDPHCGWDQNAQECKPYTTGLLQDVTNVAPSICDQCAKQYSKQVNVGESIHLPCNIPTHLLNGQQANSINSAQQPVVSWHFTSANGETTTELKLTGNTLVNLHLRQRFVQTSDGGLVVLGATTKEHGYFECRLSNKPLFRYQITVDTKTCDISNEKDFRKVYADWCQQFQKYKQELKRWQAKQMKCDANTNGLDYQQPPPNLNNLNNNYLSPNN